MTSRILASALLIFSPGAEIAFACRCGPTESRGQAYETSDQVFAGKVLSMQRIQDAERSFYQREVTLLLDESFKGGSCDTVVLYTGVGSGDCGYPFEVDSSYVIYAHWSPEPFPCAGRMTRATLVTTRCRRTMAWNEEEALRAIGKANGQWTYPK